MQQISGFQGLIMLISGRYKMTLWKTCHEDDPAKVHQQYNIWTIEIDWQIPCTLQDYYVSIHVQID